MQDWEERATFARSQNVMGRGTTCSADSFTSAEARRKLSIAEWRFATGDCGWSISDWPLAIYWPIGLQRSGPGLRAAVQSPLENRQWTSRNRQSAICNRQSELRYYSDSSLRRSLRAS
jgi:hypothetical protein